MRKSHQSSSCLCKPNTIRIMLLHLFRDSTVACFYYLSLSRSGSQSSCASLTTTARESCLIRTSRMQRDFSQTRPQFHQLMLVAETDHTHCLLERVQCVEGGHTSDGRELIEVTRQDHRILLISGPLLTVPLLFALCKGEASCR